jgi:hypothetical protein
VAQLVLAADMGTHGFEVTHAAASAGKGRCYSATYACLRRVKPDESAR